VKRRIVDFSLYLITDRKLVARNRSLVVAVRRALRAGVKAVQLREKDLNTRELLSLAYRMREITDKYGARLFINDRVDIALAVGADGVHLTQRSVPADAVRKTFNRMLLIGVSTHSLKEAREAEYSGADFVTFGPVYRTLSKLKYGEPLGTGRLKRVCREVGIPVFAIGGIKGKKASEVKETGAYGVAMISGILGVNDITKKTRELINIYGV
jgi:thiamine-phosphate pyrophosphorylase